MDSRDYLAFYPFVVVRIACVRGPDRFGSRGLRRNSDRKRAFATFWTDFPMTVCGGPKREANGGRTHVASICRTLNSRVRPTCRPAL